MKDQMDGMLKMVGQQKGIDTNALQIGNKFGGRDICGMRMEQQWAERQAEKQRRFLEKQNRLPVRLTQDPSMNDGKGARGKFDRRVVH